MFQKGLKNGGWQLSDIEFIGNLNHFTTQPLVHFKKVISN